MGNSYNLEKPIWTNKEFELMSWHDNLIHAISFQPDLKLALDIDYIFEWVRKPNAKYFKFWIAPATLIFDKVYNIVFDIALSEPSQLIIDNISMSKGREPKNAEHIGFWTEYDWVIETINGEISFTSIGFNQYIRKEPILITQQKLKLKVEAAYLFLQLLKTDLRQWCFKLKNIYHAQIQHLLHFA